MAVIHDGTTAPDLPEYMNPADEDFFYVGWKDKLEGSTISANSWVIPDGFAIVPASETENESVISKGVTYDNVNGVGLTTTLKTGEFKIENRCEFADGRKLNRGFYVTLSEKT